MTTTLGINLTDWSSVSLDELNRRAALLDRDENKYVVSAEKLSQVLDEARDDFDVLTIDGVNGFTYDTVYFDTPDLLCYHQHAQGRRLRMKVRSRRYVDSGLYFFEVKLKGSRGRTIKCRMPYTAEQHGSVSPEAGRFLSDAVAKVYGSRPPGDFLPTLGMTYGRVTLVGRNSPERVTIDHTLGFRTISQAHDAPTSTVIVEVKSPDGHGHADQLFRDHHIRPQSCSKYCVGLGLMTTGLRYNAFNRTLRTHFDWEGPSTMLTDHAAEVIRERVVGNLVLRCREVPRPRIEKAVAEELEGFRGASVHGYLDVLVSRAALRRLSVS